MNTEYPKILKNTIELFKNSKISQLKEFADDLQCFNCEKVHRSTSIHLFIGPEYKENSDSTIIKKQPLIRVEGINYPTSIQFIEKDSQKDSFSFNVISSCKLSKSKGAVINGYLKTYYNSFMRPVEYNFKIKGSKVFAFTEKTDEITK